MKIKKIKKIKKQKKNLGNKFKKTIKLIILKSKKKKNKKLSAWFDFKKYRELNIKYIMFRQFYFIIIINYIKIIPTYIKNFDYI